MTLYTTAATKKSCRSKMLYMISSWSVTDGISLSFSKSKLVYSSLMLVDNKLTLICLLTFGEVTCAIVVSCA